MTNHSNATSSSDGPDSLNAATYVSVVSSKTNIFDRSVSYFQNFYMLMLISSFFSFFFLLFRIFVLLCVCALINVYALATSNHVRAAIS